MIKPGDRVTFHYVAPNDMGGITLVRETGLIVDEITEEWDHGEKITVARVGRTKYDMKYLKKEKK